MNTFYVIIYIGDSMLEDYIDIIKPYIMDLFKEDSSGHDIGHLLRTMNLALTICDKEGGDRLVVGIASFMHDIHRIMQNECGHFVSPIDSLPKVRNILSNTDLSSDIIDKICYAIEHHEEYSWSGTNVDDKNTLILQDADNLDAIGAIGIGRAFNYSGVYNIPMYVEDMPFDESDDYEDSNNDLSTIHHFYHKLFKLGENMNTKAAKAIAHNRIEFMKNFTEEFLNEWNGVS